MLDEILEKTAKLDNALDGLYNTIVELGRIPPRIRNLVRELKVAIAE